MNGCRILFVLLSFGAFAFPVLAAPVIDPIPNANIPAGKTLILPVTAGSPNGRPLTFTATSSTPTPLSVSTIATRLHNCEASSSTKV